MIIDIIYAILLLLSFIHGFRKGLIHSVVSLIAMVIGMMAAVHFSQLAAVTIDKWLNISSQYLPLVSFIVVLLGIYLLFRLLEKALEGFFKLLQLNFINKMAGAIIWGLVWTLLYSTILFYLNNMKALNPTAKNDSVIYEQVEPLAPKTITIIGKLIPPVKNIFNDLQEWFIQKESENAINNKGV